MLRLRPVSLPFSALLDIIKVHNVFLEKRSPCMKPVSDQAFARVEHWLIIR